jgi:hypothetical protein
MIEERIRDRETYYAMCGDWDNLSDLYLEKRQSIFIDEYNDIAYDEIDGQVTATDMRTGLYIVLERELY